MEHLPEFERKIREVLPKLSDRNRVAAQLMISRPEQLICMKLSEFAELCSCDSSQIVRLCQKLGYDGFPALKNAISSELLERSRKKLHNQIPVAATPFEQLKEHCCQNLIHTLRITAELLDEKNVETACRMIKNAKRILISGFGSSRLAAQDLYSKLLRLNLPALVLEDAEMVRIYANTLSGEDLMVLISFSGSNSYILEEAMIARKRGIPLLALTGDGSSKLSNCADCILLTSANETLPRIAAMDSMASQFFVLDILCLMLSREATSQTENRILQLFEATVSR